MNSRDCLRKSQKRRDIYKRWRVSCTCAPSVVSGRFKRVQKRFRGILRAAVAKLYQRRSISVVTVSDRPHRQQPSSSCRRCFFSVEGLQVTLRGEASEARFRLPHAIIHCRVNSRDYFRNPHTGRLLEGDPLYILFFTCRTPSSASSTSSGSM